MYTLDVYDYELDSPMAIYGGVPLLIATTRRRRRRRSGSTRPRRSSTSRAARTASPGRRHHLVLDERERRGRRDAAARQDAARGPSPVRVAHRRDAAPAALRPRLPPVPVELQRRGRRALRARAVRGARHPVRRALARHRAHRRQAVLHVGLVQVPQARRRCSTARRHRAQDGDHRRPAHQEGLGYKVYQEAHDKKLFIQKKDGTELDGWCWPGSSAYLDFTSAEVRDWWAERFAYDKYEGSTEHAVHVERHERAVRLQRPGGVDGQGRQVARGRRAPRVAQPVRHVHAAGHRDGPAPPQRRPGQAAVCAVALLLRRARSGGAPSGRATTRASGTTSRRRCRCCSRSASAASPSPAPTSAASSARAAATATPTRSSSRAGSRRARTSPSSAATRTTTRRGASRGRLTSDDGSGCARSPAALPATRVLVHRLLPRRDHRHADDAAAVGRLPRRRQDLRDGPRVPRRARPPRRARRPAGRDRPPPSTSPAAAVVRRLGRHGVRRRRRRRPSRRRSTRCPSSSAAARCCRGRCAAPRVGADEGRRVHVVGGARRRRRASGGELYTSTAATLLRLTPTARDGACAHRADSSSPLATAADGARTLRSVAVRQFVVRAAQPFWNASSCSASAVDYRCRTPSPTSSTRILTLTLTSNSQL